MKNLIDQYLELQDLSGLEFIFKAVKSSESEDHANVFFAPLGVSHVKTFMNKDVESVWGLFFPYDIWNLYSPELLYYINGLIDLGGTVYVEQDVLPKQSYKSTYYKVTSSNEYDMSPHTWSELSKDEFIEKEVEYTSVNAILLRSFGPKK